MSKNKKNSKFKEFILKQKQMRNDLKEFSNKHDLGQCIFVSIFKGTLLCSEEDIDTETIKSTLYSTIGNIYMKVIEVNGGNQTVRDWVNQDIEIAIMLLKKLYLSEEQNNE